jgi:hypothetical protein
MIKKSNKIQSLMISGNPICSKNGFLNQLLEYCQSIPMIDNKNHNELCEF